MNTCFRVPTKSTSKSINGRGFRFRLLNNIARLKNCANCRAHRFNEFNNGRRKGLCYTNYRFFYSHVNYSSIVHGLMQIIFAVFCIVLQLNYGVNRVALALAALTFFLSAAPFFFLYSGGGGWYR